MIEEFKVALYSGVLTYIDLDETIMCTRLTEYYSSNNTISVEKITYSDINSYVYKHKDLQLEFEITKEIFNLCISKFNAKSCKTTDCYYLPVQEDKLEWVVNVYEKGLKVTATCKGNNCWETNVKGDLFLPTIPEVIKNYIIAIYPPSKPSNELYI